MKQENQVPPLNTNTAARDTFELWFFRDLTEEQRMSLFRLAGLPVEEIVSQAAERLSIRYVTNTLTKQPAASEGDVACFRMIGPDGEVGGWVNRTKDNYPLPILKTDWRWEFAYTSKQAAGEAVLAHEPMVPRKDMQRLYNAYVRLLESGRDRIRDLGGECDGVDVMERNDLDLRHARDVLTTPASDGDGGRVDTSLIETAIGTMQMTLDAQAGTMVTLHRTRAGQVLEALRVALAALLAGTP